MTQTLEIGKGAKVESFWLVPLAVSVILSNPVLLRLQQLLEFSSGFLPAHFLWTLIKLFKLFIRDYYLDLKKKHDSYDFKVFKVIVIK